MVAASRSTDASKRDRMELRAASSTMAVMTECNLAYEGAPRVLEEHGRMRLAGADAAAFLDAVAAPARPAERLVKAVCKHRTIAG
jgi:uncharacterized protein (DUF1778 family)